MDPRRWLLLTVTAIAVLLQHSSALSPRARPPQPQPVARFGFESVQHIAQQRSSEPYRDRSGKLPESLSKISYDDYRNIQFRGEQALWRGQALFEVQFFHRGFAYDRRVNVTEIGDDGVLRAINYDPSQFDFGKGAAAQGPAGRSGIRRAARAFPVAAPRLQGRADRISRRLLLPAARARPELWRLGARPGHQRGQYRWRGVSPISPTSGWFARPRGSAR